MNVCTFRFPWPGSALEITLESAEPEPQLRKEAGKAVELARFVQSFMSGHVEDSDLARLNACAHIAPLRVHPWTHQALTKAVSLCAETEGAFDITVMPRVVRGGPAARHQSSTGLTGARRWEDIELLPDCSVRFRGPLSVDLRGMMSGFAVDKAIDYLGSRREIARATVTAGGETRACAAGARALPVPPAIAQPAAGAPALMLRPAVSTVPAWFARTPWGTHKAGPVIHPRSGKLLRSNKSISLFARTSLEACALTRAVLLSPQALWNRLLKAHDSVALILTARGEQVLFPV